MDKIMTPGTLKYISVSEDFSPSPGGRYRCNSRRPECSGEAFREDILAPALREHDLVVVNIDGLKSLDGEPGFSGPWGEEAFGGPVRVHGLTFERLREGLKVEGGVPTDRLRLRNFIKVAWRLAKDDLAKVEVEISERTKAMQGDR